MAIIITKGIRHLPGESEFWITDERDRQAGEYDAVKIHPWSRYVGTEDEDRSVYISVGEYDRRGETVDSASGDVSERNIIVDREDFVFALLMVFPELKRA